jgi:hypothetical protein
MKRIFICLAIIATVLIACSKDEDSPSYSQDKLNGTWENVVKNDNGCANQLIISASSMKESTICGFSRVTVTYESYAFDGKTITAKVMGMTGTYSINELTDTKLVLTINDEKKEYKRITEN